MPTSLDVISALRQISSAINAAWNLDTTLDLLVERTTNVMQVDSCAVYLLDSDEYTLRLRATTGLANESVGKAVLHVGEGMTGKAVQQNRAIFAREAQQHPAFKFVAATQEGEFHSLLAVPLTLQTNRVIGALNVQTRTPRDFSPAEVELLALIGALASGAIAKAELLDRQQRQLQDLNALVKLSEAVTSPQYLDEMLRVVTEMAVQLMNATVCSIFLLDDSQEWLVLHAAARKGGSVYRHRPPLKVGLGVIGKVAESGKQAWVLDVRYNAQYLRPDLAKQEGLVSLLAVPLTVRGNVIGVFNCYTSEFHAFNQQEVALLTTLANQTALAIENSRLVANAAMVREMHHRIKNNLQNIVMLMQLQLLDSANLNAQDVLETNIHRVQSIAVVHEVLSERGFHSVDVLDVLQRVVSVTNDALIAPTRQIQVHVQGQSFSLPSRSATSLVLVVNELLQNALEHAFAEQTQGNVWIVLEKSHTHLQVRVRDDGKGLPAGTSATELKGLGLQIARTLVTEELHGQLQFLPQAPGLEIVIQLPL
ncbi:MAG TPA: GAF domain-containing protein [Anaerolineales bacterium]|nr:GAF domain-containing protein [Anaerolineales bacterium]